MALDHDEELPELDDDEYDDERDDDDVLDHDEELEKDGDLLWRRGTRAAVIGSDRWACLGGDRAWRGGLRRSSRRS